MAAARGGADQSPELRDLFWTNWKSAGCLGNAVRGRRGVTERKWGRGERRGAARASHCPTGFPEAVPTYATGRATSRATSRARRRPVPGAQQHGPLPLKTAQLDRKTYTLSSFSFLHFFGFLVMLNLICRFVHDLFCELLNSTANLIKMSDIFVLYPFLLQHLLFSQFIA